MAGMLERQLVPRPRLRAVVRALPGVIAVAGGAALVLRPADRVLVVQPPIIVTAPAPSIPAPQVVVELPGPPEPPPAPEPVVAAVEPPVIGTTCVADPSTIGLPV